MNIKDFCKWLGVSEKIAKLVIWLFIGMCFLIVTNVMLESIGLPYYKITVDNLSKLNSNKIVEFISAWLMCFLNFYSMVLIVFRTKEFKKILPYSLLYLALNAIISELFGYVAAQIYIPLFICIFCYIYSKKNWRYIFYSLGSYVFNVLIQYVFYMYKLRFVEITNSDYFIRFLASIDFLIVMFLIIFIKEIIMKKKKR